MSRHSEPPKLKRALDPEKRQQVLLPLNEHHVALINHLLATGMWGGTASQVAMRLFDTACIAHQTKTT